MTHLDDRLSAYLDGEISVAERSEVSKHLEACSRCRHELEQLADVRGRVRALPAVELPDGLLPDADEVPETGSRRWSPSPIGAVAAALVVVTGLLAVAAFPRDEPVPSGELSLLLAAYSTAGPQVAAMAPSSTVGEMAKSWTEMPDEVAGVPRQDFRGLDDQAAVGYYTDGDTSFALLSSYRPLDVAELGARQVSGPGGEYLRVEGDESVMYVWRSGTRWMALLGAMGDESVARLLAELPPPHEPGLLARVGSWIGD